MWHREEASETWGSGGCGSWWWHNTRGMEVMGEEHICFFHLLHGRLAKFHYQAPFMSAPAHGTLMKEGSAEHEV